MGYYTEIVGEIAFDRELNKEESRELEYYFIYYEWAKGFKDNIDFDGKFKSDDAHRVFKKIREDFFIPKEIGLYGEVECKGEDLFDVYKFIFDGDKFKVYTIIDFLKEK
jgi:hypothetical protein